MYNLLKKRIDNYFTSNSDQTQFYCKLKEDPRPCD